MDGDWACRDVAWVVLIIKPIHKVSPSVASSLLVLKHVKHTSHISQPTR
jgi:hypothetical protein